MATKNENEKIIDLPYFIKSITYGAPGAGKTVYLGSVADVPELMPAALFDFESGTMSISSKLERRVMDENFLTIPPTPGKISHYRLKTWGELQEVLDILYNAKENPYKTLLIDSLTEINTVSLNEAVANNPKNPDGLVPILQDYGKSAAQMRGAIRDFRDLDMNVFFACLAQESKDETTGAITIKPSLTGKLADEVAALVDIVGYLTTEGNRDDLHRIMYFQPVGRAIAKDRTEGGRLGTKIENPSLKALVDLLK